MHLHFQLFFLFGILFLFFMLLFWCFMYLCKVHAILSGRRGHISAHIQAYTACLLIFEKDIKYKCTLQVPGIQGNEGERKERELCFTKYTCQYSFWLTPIPTLRDPGNIGTMVEVGSYFEKFSQVISRCVLPSPPATAENHIPRFLSSAPAFGQKAPHSADELISLWKCTQESRCSAMPMA